MDAIVSYRPNYNGETSLTVIEALRHGVVPIVRKIGWFDELPDDIVMKVSSEAEVKEAVVYLVENREVLETMKAKAKKYAAEHLNYETYAKKLHAYISKQNSENVSQNTAIARALKSGAGLDQLLKLVSSKE